MYDAFFKIDSSKSSSVTNGRDQRIELLKWMHGYQKVIDYGFTALGSISNDEEAKIIFHRMGIKGHGMVLLK